jgi:hypothetical protein
MNVNDLPDDCLEIVLSQHSFAVRNTVFSLGMDSTFPLFLRLTWLVCKRWKDLVYRGSTGDVDLSTVAVLDDEKLSSVVLRFPLMTELYAPYGLDFTRTGLRSALETLSTTLTTLKLGGMRFFALAVNSFLIALFSQRSVTYSSVRCPAFRVYSRSHRCQDGVTFELNLFDALLPLATTLRVLHFSYVVITHF